MFRRKLVALDYQNANEFNHTDEAEFRKVIVWVEDQKIRHLKIEDRGPLRNMCAGDWNTAYHRYLDDLSCPTDKTDKAKCLDWLLGHAVRLEYGDNIDKYKGAQPNSMDSPDNKTSANPLDSLDFDSPDFKAGVSSLASLLQIPPHHDHLVVLQAICLVIKERLSPASIAKASKIKPPTKEVPTLPLDKMDLGFETSDYISQEAAKILRLLHLRDLRELQTQINEAIVQVQAFTANPKTDTRLGKVGR